MKILWNNPTQSGIGDRLCDLMYVAAYAKLYNAELLTKWAHWEHREELDTPHRKIDIELSNIKKYLIFPKNIHFDSNLKADAVWSFYLGGGISPEDFYARFVDKNSSLEEYKNCLNIILKEFGFCEDIEKRISDLPEKFIAFHIRRGDKVRSVPNDNGITYDEVEHLNSLTLKCIDESIENGHENFFVCGDEEDKLKLFTDYIESKQKICLKYEISPKWKSTYFELAILSKASEIVLSQKYSSFSFFSSLLGGSNFKTVYSL